MNRRHIFIFLLLFIASQLAGQKLAESTFDNYTTSTGLSNNIVSGITQDSTGYVWIATAYGLNRFNGSRFVQFHSNSDSCSMAAESLNGLTWIGRNKLAVYTSGLHIINTKTGKSHNIFIPYHNTQYQYKFNMIVRAGGDDSGNIFILTRSGFYHYDKDHKLVSRFDYYSEEQLPFEHFFFGRDLFELDAKRLLIVSIGGLYMYDKDKKKVKKLEAADCPPLAEFLDYPNTYFLFLQHKPGHLFVLKSDTDSLVYINVAQNRKVISKLPFSRISDELHWRSRMITVSDTCMYITGHNSGFFKMQFNPRSGTVKLFPERYFQHYLCNAVFRDKDDQIWVATNKGVFRQNPLRSLVQVAALPAAAEDSFPNVRVDDVSIAGDKLFAGTRARGGLYVFDKNTLSFVERIDLMKKYPGKADQVYALAPVGASSVMFGTSGPLLLYDTKSKKQKHLVPPGWHESFWVNDLYPDRQGKIWIGAYEIYRYDPATGQFKGIPHLERLLRVPFVLEQDTSGNMWMAGHGLARYNVALDTIDLVIDSFPYIKMMDKQVNSMVVDNQNVVWFNSNNNGLAGYDIHKRTFRHYTRSHGLPDDNISSLMIVGNHLWIACFSGIACMDLKTSRIISFGKEDGFPDMPVLRGARFAYDSSTNQLYLGFSTTIAKFKPHTLLLRKSPPHMFIESLAINGRRNNFLPGRSITTSWKYNEIRVTIGTINFLDGASQRFAYRLVKNEATPWIQMGSQPSFGISSLSPGTHRIQVKCFSPSNRWTEQVKEITVIVLPPLWMKDWFILLMLTIVVILVYLLIRWRTELVRRKEMEKTHIEKLKADDYKNQFELEQISNYFSSSLVSKKTEDEVLWDVASNLIGRMNYVDCMIYLWNHDKTKMVQKAAFGPKGKPEYISQQVFEVLPGQGIVGHVVETQQPVLVNDTRTDSRYRVDDEFRLSEVCVPIIHNDELLGAIDSEHYLPNAFSERDIKILTTIATLIGNKLKQIESEKTLDAKRKELATINEHLAEARLAALQAQMNPHFVFNALNSIKRMILDADNEKASRYLSKFALMIRMTLNHSKEIFVTLDENIQYLRAYLEMEQLRFDDSFTYCISTGDNIEAAETPIPSLMIQPLVENAIWHGLMQAGPDKKILISFTQHENRIRCTVEDNGIGIKQASKQKEQSRSTHQSVGLENLQKRIKIMNDKYDMDCTFTITDLSDTGENKTGTRVVLEFNLINT